MEKFKDTLLEKARIYEENNMSCIDKKDKPSFHVSAPIGWINDPNGFSEYKGEYHLFYQYYPYKNIWGPMHWGHCKTHDFIKWEHMPVALAPDKEYDKQGCFSGSAIEYKGKHILMYTGVIDKETEDGEHYLRQTQCIAIGDGKNYKKLECNPVISSNLIPEGSSLEDFRDPKIWADNDRFYAVVGSRNEDKSGQILMYTSKNLREWEYVTTLDRSSNKIGKMWECPDFFNIDGHDILMISPQDMKADGLEFHNGHGTVYILGRYDKDKRIFTREKYSAVDYGLDFYAPQTMQSKDGRRIMIGWMHSWSTRIVPEDFKWCGMMTIPRELKVLNNMLIQNPVREIENYYKNEKVYKNAVIQQETSFDGIEGRQIDMTVEILEGSYHEFEINIAQNEEYQTSIRYNSLKNILTFDRTNSGTFSDVIHTRSINVQKKNKKIKLRFILDKYSVEIFVNDGEKVMTSTIYTAQSAKQISFKADKSAVVNIIKHDIIL